MNEIPKVHNSFLPLNFEYLFQFLLKQISYKNTRKPGPKLKSQPSNTD